MIQIGTVQTLKVLRITSVGAYLGEVCESGDRTTVFTSDSSSSRPVRETPDSPDDPPAVFSTGTCSSRSVCNDMNGSPDPLAVFNTSSGTASISAASRTSRSRQHKEPAARVSQPENNEKDGVLLPNNELKSPVKTGDTVTAFIYLDSSDRPVATLKKPLLTIGSFALLEVMDVNKIGAFLDWGLPKQLFLPFKEQTVRVIPGQKVLVSLYTDRSGRLCATMKLYRLLRTDSCHKTSDYVTGTVYEVSDTHGAYVAVDDIFSGRIPQKELIRKVEVGEILRLRVSRVLEDGKLELSLREPGYLQIHMDCDTILKALAEAPSKSLPYNDSSSPEALRERFNMSKNSFKRAVGHLMKEKKIELSDDGIHLL